MADGFGRIPRFVTKLLPVLGPHAMAVYAVLADDCLGDRYSQLAHRELQRRTGCSSPTVTAALKRLEEHGCIRRLRDHRALLSFHLPLYSSVFADDTDERGVFASNTCSPVTQPNVPLRPSRSSVFASNTCSPVTQPVLATNTPLTSIEEPRTKDTIVHRRTKAQVKADAERFERWWAEYPRKEAKKKASDWWAVHHPSDELTDTMIAAVKLQRVTPKWTSDGGKYIPLPTTWLNGERWDDQGVDTGLFGGDNGHTPAARLTATPLREDCDLATRRDD